MQFLKVPSSVVLMLYLISFNKFCVRSIFSKHKHKYLQKKPKEDKQIKWEPYQKTLFYLLKSKQNLIVKFYPHIDLHAYCFSLLNFTLQNNKKYIQIKWEANKNKK